MERTITGIVGEVTGRTVGAKNDTIFDIPIGDEKPSTFKEPLAQEAKALQGSTVEATVYETTVQKDDRTFKNLTLLSVKLVDASGASQARETPAAIPVAGPRNDDDTAARIARSVAFEHMPQYFDALPSDLDEIYELLNDFARWIYNGQTPAFVAHRQGVAVGADVPKTTEDLPW